MKVLITGNMGYIGPVVVQQLRATDPYGELIGLDIGYFSHCLTSATRLPECALNLQHFSDVRTLSESALAGIDAVVYLAAISNDPLSREYESVTMDVNCRAASQWARAAKRAGARSFVLASSCSVYGFAESGPRTEHSEVNPLTTYARSKLQAENALADIAADSFTVTCLRFGTACGMSPRLRLDLVLNDFVASALATGRVTVLSDGSPWRPLINVRDMARAIEWAITRDSRVGGNFLVVNTGSDRWNFQVKDLAYAVADIIPDITVSINRSAQPDRRSYRVDFSLFRELAPLHQPQCELKDTIVGLREGLEAMNFRDPDFRNSQLIRLKALAHLRSQGYLTDELHWANGIHTEDASAEPEEAAHLRAASSGEQLPSAVQVP